MTKTFEEQIQTTLPKEQSNNVKIMSDYKLNDEELTVAKDLLSKLNDQSIESVDKFGEEVQSRISQSSKALLSDVKANDMEHLSESLNELVFAMKEIDEKDLKGINRLPIIGKFIKKSRQSLFELTQKYTSVAGNVEKIKEKLDKSKVELVEGNKRIQQIYDANMDYFKDLNIYIAAIEMKIKELEDDTIPAAREQLNVNPEDLIASEKVNSLVNYKDKLERRLTSFKISRNLTIQQAPQLMMMKKSNTDLTDKIEMSITIAVPEWYRQLAMARELMEQKQKVEITNTFDAALNDILNKNSAFLGDSTVEIAKAKERDMIDVETLRNSQNKLINTIKEVAAIEHDGAEHRKQVQIELENMENDLKSKLIEVADERERLDKKYRDVTPYQKLID